MTKKKETVELTTGFAELEEITAWFERGEPDIDQGLVKFERAMAIATALRKSLTEAENTIQEIKSSHRVSSHEDAN